MLIHRAIEFAAIKHRNQTRKGTDIPYIVHPVEVMQILTANGCDEETIAAGVLHDTVEDTDATLEEIEQQFGATIAEYVQGESEDKTKSWQERKQRTIDDLKTARLEVKQICCADKLSNLKSMYYDLERGAPLWERFHAGKDRICWYYRSIMEALKELTDYSMYRELRDYFKLIFE